MNAYLTMLRTQAQIVFQYRAQAYAGAFTQFAFGFMRIFVLIAFYNNAGEQPMTLTEVVTYIWLTQILLTMMAWGPDPIIVSMIKEGTLAYELVRPVRLSVQWLMRSLAFRGAMPLMRVLPITIIAFLLPKPYRIVFSSDLNQLLIGGLVLILAWILASNLNNLMNILTVYLMSDVGLIRIYPIIYMFFSGVILPLPLFPDRYQQVIGILPFAGIMDIPARVLMGNIKGEGVCLSILIQVVWIVVIFLLNDFLLEKKLKNVSIHGG